MVGLLENLGVITYQEAGSQSYQNLSVDFPPIPTNPLTECGSNSLVSLPQKNFRDRRLSGEA